MRQFIARFAAIGQADKVYDRDTNDQLDLQALHRVRSRLISDRTAVINQIRRFLLEHGIWSTALREARIFRSFLSNSGNFPAKRIDVCPACRVRSKGRRGIGRGYRGKLLGKLDLRRRNIAAAVVDPVFT